MLLGVIADNALLWTTEETNVVLSLFASLSKGDINRLKIPFLKVLFPLHDVEDIRSYMCSILRSGSGQVQKFKKGVNSYAIKTELNLTAMSTEQPILTLSSVEYDSWVNEFNKLFKNKTRAVSIIRSYFNFLTTGKYTDTALAVKGSESAEYAEEYINLDVNSCGLVYKPHEMRFKDLNEVPNKRGITSAVFNNWGLTAEQLANIYPDIPANKIQAIRNTLEISLQQMGFNPDDPRIHCGLLPAKTKSGYKITNRKKRDAITELLHTTLGDKVVEPQQPDFKSWVINDLALGVLGKKRDHSSDADSNQLKCTLATENCKCVVDESKEDAKGAKLKRALENIKRVAEECEKATEESEDAMDEKFERALEDYKKAIDEAKEEKSTFDFGNVTSIVFPAEEDLIADIPVADQPDNTSDKPIIRGQDLLAEINKALDTFMGSAEEDGVIELTISMPDNLMYDHNIVSTDDTSPVTFTAEEPEEVLSESAVIEKPNLPNDVNVASDTLSSNTDIILATSACNALASSTTNEDTFSIRALYATGEPWCYAELAYLVDHGEDAITNYKAFNERFGKHKTKKAIVQKVKQLKAWGITSVNQIIRF